MKYLHRSKRGEAQVLDFEVTNDPLVEFIREISDGAAALIPKSSAESRTIVRDDGSIEIVNDGRSMPEALKSAEMDINNAAGKVRSKYITTTSGQSLVYAEKLANANLYISDVNSGAPLPDIHYEWIYAESQATGLGMLAAANSILDAANSFRSVGVAIEKKRMSALSLVKQAETDEVLREVVRNGIFNLLSML